MTSADRVATAKKYLRRKYQGNVAGLKTLVDTIAEDAFETVTITGSGYEGGNDSGQITFEKLEYLSALEDVISEMDSTVPQPAATCVLSDFSQRNALA